MTYIRTKFFQGTGFQACHCGISRGRFDRKPTDRHLCLSNRRLSALKYGRVGPQHDQVATAFNECLREPCCCCRQERSPLADKTSRHLPSCCASATASRSKAAQDFGLVPEVLVEGAGAKPRVWRSCWYRSQSSRPPPAHRLHQAVAPCGTVGSDIDRVVPKTRHRCIVPQLVINLSPIKVFGKECIRDDAW
jgi:hypothetical protein